MNNTENTQNGAKRFFTWLAFIVIIGLIIWGLIAADKKTANESALLPLPDQITSADHVKGSDTAPVTLVEYGDFQCPACGVYYPIVTKVLTDEGSSTVRFVFRHFPLTQHANAIPAALASEAAGNQGKFWEMYDMLYSNQDDWAESATSSAMFAGYAGKLGLDMDKYNADVASKETLAVVTADYNGGVKAGIDHTPTFYINGKQIDNLQGYDDFKKDIDAAASTTTHS